MKKERITHEVVINKDGEYAIWLKEPNKLPHLWHSEGKKGSLDECFEYIKEMKKNDASTEKLEKTKK